MKKRYSILIYILALLFLGSCSNLDKVEDKVSFVMSLSISDDENVLRKNISFATTEEVSCHIEYWKDADRSDLRCSAKSPIAMNHSITVLILEAESTYSFRVVGDGVSSGEESDIYTFETGVLSSEIATYIGDVQCQIITTEGLSYIQIRYPTSI